MENEPKDSMDVTPEMALADALKEMREDKYDVPGMKGPPSKAIVILLWDDDGMYYRRFYNAGMKCSEIIALLEIQKAMFVNWMTQEPKRDEDE